MCTCGHSRFASLVVKRVSTAFRKPQLLSEDSLAAASPAPPSPESVLLELGRDWLCLRMPILVPLPPNLAKCQRWSLFTSLALGPILFQSVFGLPPPQILHPGCYIQIDCTTYTVYKKFIFPLASPSILTRKPQIPLSSKFKTVVMS